MLVSVVNFDAAHIILQQRSIATARTKLLINEGTEVQNPRHISFYTYTSLSFP